MSYFKKTAVNIEGNKNLRNPQIEACLSIREYFEQNPCGEALVVLPTGTGKTGVALISPYGVSNGRVLIITPGLVTNNSIKKESAVLQDNFWVNQDIIFNPASIPVVSEYDASISQEHLEQSHFVHCNIHKIVGDRNSSLITRVAPDFFDMIIIDEAHHAPAKSWQDVLDYFSNSKKLHLTGTPYRGDGQPVQGDKIHETKLSEVMRDRHIKLLRKETVNANKLYFTLPEKPNVQLNLQAVLELKDTEWIEKSVALSENCSKDVIQHSILKLTELNKISPNVPHKILAVGCSIKHAEDLHLWYQEAGLESVIVHSKMEDEAQLAAFKSIDLNLCQVVISVNMLMEGYDHKYLTILALFRPYRSENAFAQVVGRVLRAIPESEIYEHEIDNNAVVIFHEETGLNRMWDRFQHEVDRATIRMVKDFQYSDRDYEERGKEIAGVSSEDAFVSQQDSYLHDVDCHKLFEQAREKIADKKRIVEESLKKAGLSDELISAAVEAAGKEETNNLARDFIDPQLIEKRPAEARKKMREILTKKNQDYAVDLLSDFDLDPKESNLYPLIGRFVPYAKSSDANDGLIVRYVNAKLAKKFGAVKDRDNTNLYHSLRYVDVIYEELKRILANI
ncbi:DEAD/DEAH box helicase family protein [Maridesulfovibrio sp.]|uniref:DEAD/DEAH box helicase n=1 Tax=Maridesulfovibrio sp. TaxID=2795000 RepID=UPI002A18E071|nr:DEAD/DEAH box helicase family protein [Maridesulfovibrio sp.]